MKPQNFMENLLAAIIFMCFVWVAAKAYGLTGSAIADDDDGMTFNYELTEPAPVDNDALGTNLPKLAYAFDDEQTNCLAKTMYFEARGQGTVGMEAVGNVVLNRLQDPRYPKTICDIVYFKWHHVCQFTWHCDGREFDPDTITSEKKRLIWVEVKSLASYLVQTYNTDKYVDYSHGAVNFHAYYVHPRWSKQFHRTCRIGAHIFFRRDPSPDIIDVAYR
jgi:spore germination cell wall hydrolase CwlJ-like protein